MVITTQIKPAAILKPFVNCYSLRVFDTGDTTMPQPMHAVQECYMTFFLKDKFCDTINDSGKVQNKISNNLCSLFTQSQGCNYWKGDYMLFCVQFTSNGLSAVFGIPQKNLINTILSLNDLLGNDNELLTEQLASCTDIFEMGQLMNSYLTKKLLLQNHKTYISTIAGVSKIILHQKGSVSLDKLAYHANMSLRTFERRFVDEVGMTPKRYARITRFYNAVENKMLHPYKSWTNITNESGYFDQAHFIRECKEFSNKTPEELFNLTPPPKENFISKVEA